MVYNTITNDSHVPIVDRNIIWHFIGLVSMKEIWSFLQKVGIELPLDNAIPVLGIYSWNAKTLFRKKYIYAHICPS